MELLVPTIRHSAPPFSFSKSMYISNIANWQEVIGHLISYDSTDSQIIVHLTTGQGNISLVCGVNSIEGGILNKFLERKYHDQLIGLIKTDIPDRPLLCRVMSP